MQIEQIDHYCDLFEQRLKSGAKLSAEEFLQEHRLSPVDQLIPELQKLEREYAPAVPKLNTNLST